MGTCEAIVQRMGALLAFAARDLPTRAPVKDKFLARAADMM
jgi:hypothetical protein